MKIEDIHIDPELRDLLPPLSKEEKKELEEQIKVEGCRDTLWVWKGMIADGHNRYEICHRLKIPFQVSTLGLNTKADVMLWMIKNQMGRRNLTPAQRVMMAEKYRPKIEEKARENISKTTSESNKNRANPALANLPSLNTPIDSTHTRKELSTLAKVGERTYSKIVDVMKSDNEEVKKKLMDAEISVDKAYKEAVSKKENAQPMTKLEASQIEIQFKTTADCDKAIAKIEQQEKELFERKKQLYKLRYEIYDTAPNNKLTCEVVRKNGEDFLLFDDKYCFYLVKESNKIFLWEIPGCMMTDNDEEFNKYMQSKFAHSGRLLTDQEKRLLESVIWETRKKYMVEYRDKIEAENIKYQEIDRRSKNKFTSMLIIKDASIKPTVQEVISSGYKALAKKYHPDITKDNGEQMQILNKAKDALNQVVSLSGG